MQVTVHVRSEEIPLALEDDSRIRIAHMTVGEWVHRRILERMLLEEKSGREYLRSWGMHRASAPGEPPASDTGRLVAESRWRVASPRQTNIEFPTPYAAELEYGEPSRHLAPRPFLRPTLIEAKPLLIAVLTSLFRPR